MKLDGYRLEAVKTGDKVRLYSRRGNDFTKKFAKTASQVAKIKGESFVVDGEAVVVDERGVPSFQKRGSPITWRGVAQRTRVA